MSNFSNTNNPFGVLENDDQSSDWCKVETRKQRRSRKNVIISPQVPEWGPVSNLNKSFTDRMLWEYSSKFQESNITQVCETLLSEVDEGYLKSSTNWEMLKKRVVEEVGYLAQQALFSSLSVEKEEVETQHEVEDEPKSEVVNQEDEEDNKESESASKEKDIEELEAKDLDSDNEVQVADVCEVREEAKSEQEEEEEEVKEDDEDELDDDADLEKEDREPTPEKKTLAQKLAEQAKAFDPTTLDGVKLIIEWCNNIQQPGEEGKQYRAAFKQSTIFRTVVKWLVTTSPSKQMYGAEETVELFHHILQGNNKYHEWLYNQITKLAEMISKTSSRTNIEWVTFLSNQTFALVDAQKKPHKVISELDVPEMEYSLPSEYIKTDNDNRLKLQCDQSDILCREMYRSLTSIRIKDDALMSMNPTASAAFKERYIQIQRHVSENIAKVHAHMQAQTRQLEKISENFKANERRTKERIQPIEDQLKEVHLGAQQTKNEIIEYEARLKAAQAKLVEQEALKTLLKEQITKVQVSHHPQKADLIKSHNNSRFNLEAVKRKEHCYTHLRFIALESHKHLESWSRCNINQERDSRRVLLQSFYDSVEKYVSTLFSMLNFLGKRVGFMKQTLERSESEYNQRKQFFGNSTSTIEKHIAADKEKMKQDVIMVTRLQTEIQNLLQTSFDCAMKWGTLEQIFHDFWGKIQQQAVQYQINLTSFVKLKNPPMVTKAHPVEYTHTQHYNQNPHQVRVQHYEVSQTNASLHQQFQKQRESVREQHYSQNSKQDIGQHGGHQTLLQDMQENKYQNHNQASAQVTTSRGQTVPQTQTSNQQPLKIINNATTKTYELQQNVVRDHYQNQAPPTHAQATVQGASQATQTPHQALGNNMQGYRRRARNNRRRRPPSNAKPSGGRGGMGWGGEFV